MDRALHIAEGHGVTLYISLSEILKLASLGLIDQHMRPLEQDPALKQRKLSFHGENVPRKTRLHDKLL